MSCLRPVCVLPESCPFGGDVPGSDGVELSVRLGEQSEVPTEFGDRLGLQGCAQRWAGDRSVAPDYSIKRLVDATLSAFPDTQIVVAAANPEITRQFLAAP